MLTSRATRKFGERLDNASMTTRMNVLYLLGQALYSARNGNPKRAVVYFGAGLATLEFKCAWLPIHGAFVANRIRKRLQRENIRV